MVKVKLFSTDQTSFLINESQVCEVKKGQKIKQDVYVAIIKMSNGEIYELSSPSYGEWENDIYI